MELLVFDAEGEFAHFRKIYTNSSSLSYYFPPRTTIAGMLAAILGYERDSYYDIFNINNFQVAVRIITPLRKITQTLNYIRATNLSDLTNRANPTQIPFELLAGCKSPIKYRFFIWHEEKNILNTLKDMICNNKSAYPPYFGAAPFQCSLKYVDLKAAEEIPPDIPVNIDSVVNLSHLCEGSLEINKGNTRLIKEIMPHSFKPERIPQNTASYIFDEKCKPLTMRVNTVCYRIADSVVTFL